MNTQDYFEKKKQETTKSFAFFIERVAHGPNTPYGIDFAKKHCLEDVTIVVLPGTTSGKNALKEHNGLLKRVDDFVFQSHSFSKQNVHVCCAVCHYGNAFDSDVARKLLHLYYTENKTYQQYMEVMEEQSRQEYIMPQYVTDIFNEIFYPRLFDENNQFLPFTKALNRIRKLIFVTFCHGAYTMIKLEESLSKQLSTSPYSPSQIENLLKSLVVLAYSPDCPLGLSQMQFISFASAADLTIKHDNGFIDYVHRGLFVEDFGLCYLPKKYGNVFYCAQYSQNGVEGNPRVLQRIDPEEWYENLHKDSAEEQKDLHISEHGFLGFIPHAKMSNAAIKMQQIGCRILKNAILNAISKDYKTLSTFELSASKIEDELIFLKAKIKGGILLLKKALWEKNPQRKSFASNVKIARID